MRPELTDEKIDEMVKEIIRRNEGLSTAGSAYRAEALRAVVERYLNLERRPELSERTLRVFDNAMRFYVRGDISVTDSIEIAEIMLAEIERRSTT